MNPKERGPKFESEVLGHKGAKKQIMSQSPHQLQEANTSCKKQILEGKGRVT